MAPFPFATSSKQYIGKNESQKHSTTVEATIEFAFNHCITVT